MSPILLRSPRKGQKVCKLCKHLTRKQMAGQDGEGMEEGAHSPLQEQVLEQENYPHPGDSGMPFYQADTTLQLSFLLTFKGEGEKMTLTFQNVLKSVRF